MVERYVMPLAPYVLLALDCFVLLFIYISLEKEIYQLRALVTRRPKPVETPAQELKPKLEEMSARLREIEERAVNLQAALPHATAKFSLNLNRRTEVLRMSKNGEPAGDIAASLSIPRKEVDLLLKVYGLSIERATKLHLDAVAHHARPGNQPLRTAFLDGHVHRHVLVIAHQIHRERLLGTSRPHCARQFVRRGDLGSIHLRDYVARLDPCLFRGESFTTFRTSTPSFTPK